MKFSKTVVLLASAAVFSSSLSAVAAPSKPEIAEVVSTSVLGTALNDASIKVTFGAATDAVGYSVAATAAGLEPGIGSSASCSAGSCVSIIAGLNGGQQYLIKVTAVDSAGQKSAPDSQLFTAESIPASPSAINASASNGEVELLWAAPSTSGGMPLSGYRVTDAAGSINSLVEPNLNNFKVTGLTPGISYTFFISAVNSLGESAKSAFSRVTLTKTAQSITFSTISNQTVGTPLTLEAAANSDLPVRYTASGVCTVSGSTAEFIAPGECTITASQNGSNVFNAATPVSRTFTVVEGEGGGDNGGGGGGGGVPGTGPDAGDEPIAVNFPVPKIALPEPTVKQKKLPAAVVTKLKSLSADIKAGKTPGLQIPVITSKTVTKTEAKVQVKLLVKQLAALGLKVNVLTTLKNGVTELLVKAERAVNLQTITSSVLSGKTTSVKLSATATKVLNAMAERVMTNNASKVEVPVAVAGKVTLKVAKAQAASVAKVLKKAGLKVTVAVKTIGGKSTVLITAKKK